MHIVNETIVTNQIKITMPIVGFDLGGRNLHIGKWVQDVYGLNEEGVPILVQTDHARNSAL